MQHHAAAEVRALTVEEVHAFRAAVRAWQVDPDQVGQRRSADLPDAVDMMLATGMRIGELCALRWEDVDLTNEKPTVTISGTVVASPGKSPIRQAHPKTKASYRRVTRSRFAVDMLLRRKVHQPPNELDLVFPSTTGTIKTPANLRRSFRDARAWAGFDWVVPHTFRKTVATLLDNEASTKTAASQLGHSAEAMTVKHYVQRAAESPDMSELLQKFNGPS